MHRAKLTTQPKYQHLRSLHHLCVAARWTRRAKQTRRHPARGGGAPLSLCSQQTFPPANWVWIRVLSSPLQHSALKFFTFWCNKNGRAHTNQVHIDWHSTAIFPVSEKWGSNRIWQPFDPSNWTAQRCAEGKQCSTSIMNLTFATTSLFSVTLISFIHLYFGFPFVRRADLTFNVWWSFFYYFFLVLICNEKINESFQVVKRFLSPLWIKPP